MLTWDWVTGYSFIMALLSMCLVPYSEARRIGWNRRSHPRSLQVQVELVVVVEVEVEVEVELVVVVEVEVHLLAIQSTKLQEME